MLTKADLSAIKKLVREEVEVEAKDTRLEISSSRMRLQMEIRDVSNRVKNVEVGNMNLQKDIQKMHKELKEEIKQVSNFQDVANLKTLKRVKRIEEHLNFQAPSEI